MEDNRALYVRMAMDSAVYEESPSHEFHGDIPGFYGLKAQAQTRPECAEQLRTSLEEWLNYRTQNSLSIPIVGGLRLATLKLDLKEDQRDRIQELENEITKLRIELDLDINRGKFIRGTVRGFNQWYKSYWQLIVSLASLGVIIIAYGAYGVDPIQSYRETGDKIRMAQRYVEIGDKLLLQSSGSGSPEAEKAYQAALELYPSNLDARAGLLKAQILNPEPGRNEYDIGTAQTKLSAAQAYLKEDYYLSHVEGMIAMHQALASTGSDQDPFLAKAKSSFEKSKELQPQFTGSYLGLGIYNLYLHGPMTALTVFKEACDSDHCSPAILTYLASLHASCRDFNGAWRHSRAANTLATRLDTLIVFGDVLRNKSAEFTDTKRRESYLLGAITKHLSAVAMATRKDLVRGVDYDEFFYTYMPTDSGEPTDALRSLSWSTPDSFKALANYSLSFDYILAEDKRPEADAAFAAGFASDRCPNGSEKYGKDWYLNQADYLIRERRGLSKETTAWLISKKNQFKCK